MSYPSRYLPRMTKISTSYGSLSIEPPSPTLLRNLRGVLPFGACQLPPESNSPQFGIVMQCGDIEVCAIKQQPLDYEEKEEAQRWLEIQQWMCVDALARYRTEGFSGAYLPAPYLRENEDGKWEAGISHFIFPSPSGIEAQEFPYDPAYDDLFGHGATIMLKRFLFHLKAAFLRSGLTSPQYFSLNVHPRLHLQSLAMNFLAFGPHVLCLREDPRAQEDPAWMILARAGINTVYHMPSAPAAIDAADLAITKFAPPSAL